MSDTVEQYLLDNLDIQRRQRYATGDELVLKECLFCGRPEKMYVNLSKLRFNCFSVHCNARGNLVALIMAIEDC